MKSRFLNFFLILFFATIVNATAEKIIIVDINSLIANSKAGQSIKSKLKEEKDSLVKQFKKKEEDLIKQEQKLVSQKNVLSEEEFRIKAKTLNEKINLYKKEKKTKLDEVAKNRNKRVSILLEAINELLIDYSTKNSITLVVDKKYTIISKNEIDLTNVILDSLNEKIKKIN